MDCLNLNGVGGTNNTNDDIIQLKILNKKGINNYTCFR
jgi:hypothetical protein